jgi:hypothetical protein
MNTLPFLGPGQLLNAAGAAVIQDFIVHRLAKDAIELVFVASGLKVRIPVERLAKFEIGRAIEKKLGGKAKVGDLMVGF